MAFVEVNKLVKNYNDFCAVDNLSFEVKEGEVFGLIGPNGAGKSTTMNIITALDDFNSGSVKVNGLDIVKDRQKVRGLIGLVPQEIALYPYLTALENVEFFASLYGLNGKELRESALKALEFTGLSDKASMKPKKMSGGMKRRLNIACGIAHHPKLIVMDEPTVGVDAQSRELIMNSILSLKAKGATVIYTSHYMHEVETICDRIVIIDHGQLVASGTEQELVNMITDCRTIKIKTRLISAEKDKVIAAISALPGVNGASAEDGNIKIDVRLTENDFTYIIDEIRKFGLPLISVNCETPDLDAVFLALTGHDIR